MEMQRETSQSFVAKKFALAQPVMADPPWLLELAARLWPHYSLSSVELRKLIHTAAEIIEAMLSAYLDAQKYPNSAKDGMCAAYLVSLQLGRLATEGQIKELYREYEHDHSGTTARAARAYRFVTDARIAEVRAGRLYKGGQAK